MAVYAPACQYILRLLKCNKFKDVSARVHANTRGMSDLFFLNLFTTIFHIRV